MDLTLSVLDGEGRPRAQRTAADEVFLVFRETYAEGDVVAIEARGEAGGETAGEGIFVHLSLDDAMAPALVFLKGGRFALPVPFGPRRKTYSPRAFSGELHRLSVRLARPEELAARRDLALNPYDDPGNASAFPHASANVETRGEAVFAARNAIDGECANDDHGFWPYTSWGINQDPNAALTLDFGRPVRLDEVALTLRADFPHDAWWRQADIVLSDGSRETLNLVKTDRRQGFAIVPRVVEWLRLERLVKADDPSPFPALTRIEAFGHEA
ncbi:carbohydrate-binding protein [Aureimonas ureilytica]|uniref:carbohydrate-binding protein n=1 Tax=Aureimonas ureilytica TaxID=401562 RepID=UPI003CE97662